MKIAIALLVVCFAGGCGDDGGASLEFPAVPAGAYEASCQTLCTLAAGEATCTADHASFCVASCRAHTNGLPTACGDCMIAAGTQIHGIVSGAGDDYCDVGGAGEIEACAAECGATSTPAPELDALCTLECAFYVQDPDPIACSADGSADCLTACRAVIAAQGRECAQCLIDQTQPSQSCINNVCDCQPFFNDDAQVGCMALCDGV